MSKYTCDCRWVGDVAIISGFVAVSSCQYDLVSSWKRTVVIVIGADSGVIGPILCGESRQLLQGARP